ncbi:MAG: hypothetical protein AAFQ17_07510 [Pseudomonadota bacterium]
MTPRTRHTPGVLTIRVPGLPAPGGSKKAFVINGKARLTDAGKNNKPWRQAVAAFAVDAMREQGFAMIRKPQAIACRMAFHMPRPRSHFHTTAVSASSVERASFKASGLVTG